MSSVDEVWRAKADEQVLQAAAGLGEFTAEGQRAILREAERRGLNVSAVIAASDERRAHAPTGGESRECGYCGTWMLFGGVGAGGMRFCNDECRSGGIRLAASHQIPGDVVRARLGEVHHGVCQQCGGPGPVDVHISYRALSMLLMTTWRSRLHLCCRSCGNKARALDAAYSLALGWWGLPWGVVITPVQIARNVFGAVRYDASAGPSPLLERMVRVTVAEELLSGGERKD